ncbi:MAG: hypothetical protein JWP69_1658 [Flaviaesturariibacter sp.]|nr:hypothetical protein [Flaviaesturariibacter sp.]
MKIKLGLLDRWKPISYETTVEVALVINNDYRSIGFCKIVIDDAGNHYGELDLREPIDQDLYLYYRIGESDGSSWFYGVDLMDHQHQDRRTIKIKDARV